MLNAANLSSLLNEIDTRRFLTKKKSIPPIEKLEELSRRYGCPIPHEQIAKIECGSLAGANMRRATADLRSWENDIINVRAACRDASTPDAVSILKGCLDGLAKTSDRI